MHTRTHPLETLARAVGLRLSDWFERWFPDAFALALTAVAIVFARQRWRRALTPCQSAQWFGAGFWDLVAFTHADVDDHRHRLRGGDVAAGLRRDPPAGRVPKTGRGAAAFVALFSMLASLVSWSFSLIFSGLLAREVARRVEGADYRAIGAAAYLGVGSVWALGLSSSAALIMAAPASLPDAIEKISGVIPLSQTLGLWQSLLIAAGADRGVDGIALLLGAARRRRRAGMEDMGVTYAPATQTVGTPQKPGEWLEYSPLLTIVVVRARASAISRARWPRPGRASCSISITTSSVPDGRTAAALAAAIVRPGDRRAQCTPVGGVLIQYPIYAGIVQDDDGVGHRDAAGALLRRRLDGAHLPGDDRHLLGVPRAVHSVSRRQVADRGAVHARRRASRCTCISAGWCRPTTPPRRWPT